MSSRAKTKTFTVLALSAAFLYLVVLNVADRFEWKRYDDGVQWQQSSLGWVVSHVKRHRLTTPEGIPLKKGDRLIAINDLGVRSQDEYEEIVDALTAQGLESLEVEYEIERPKTGEVVAFRGAVVWRPSFGAIDGALAALALAHLAIGLFIFVRSARSEGALHFYWICLTAFLVFGLSASGRADSFDLGVELTDTIALLLLPALFLHFCCVFPRHIPSVERSPRLLPLVYVPFLGLSLLYVLWLSGAMAWVGLPRNHSVYRLWENVHLIHFLLLAGLGALVLARLQRRLASPIERYQLKWIVSGAVFGLIPAGLLYGIPFLAGIQAEGLEFAVLSLGLIPLGFGYAISRYRLMDVDIIFKKGAAYVLTSSTSLALYVGLVIGLGWLAQSLAGESEFWVFAAGALLVAFLFAPVKGWFQERIDRHFYREQYSLRVSFSDFGRTLGSEIQLPELTRRICDGISAALDVSPVGIFLRVEEGDEFRAYRHQPEWNDEPAGLRVAPAMLAEPRPIHLDPENAGVPESPATRTLLSEGIEYLQPLRVRGRVMGFMGLGRRQGGGLLSSDDLDLIAALADYAAIAIDNALLYASLEAKAAQLSQLKAHSDTVIESLTVGVVVVDSAGVISVWNPAMATLYGMERRQALGRGIGEVFPEDVIRNLRRHFDGSHWVTDSTRNLLKTRLKRHDGRERICNLTIAPFVTRDDVQSGVLILVDDITERVQLENQLLQAEKLSSIGLFAAGIAHEVNTPLTGISSYTQMLLSKSPPDSPEHDMLKRIETQSFRASQIINNLLNFARVKETDNQDVSVNGLMNDTVALLEHQFRSANIEVQLDCDPYLPKTIGNGGKLQQVFMNLFLNAKDAMPGGGVVSIRTYRDGSNAIVEVSDTGEGISEEDVRRIYDPFFTTKEVGKGTGLGLSVSYGIIKEHSGSIDVASAPGAGTRFTIQLPIKRVN